MSWTYKKNKNQMETTTFGSCYVYNKLLFITVRIEKKNIKFLTGNSLEKRLIHVCKPRPEN
jgi:hypothetical protein